MSKNLSNENFKGPLISNAATNNFIKNMQPLYQNYNNQVINNAFFVNNSFQNRLGFSNNKSDFQIYDATKLLKQMIPWEKLNEINYVSYFSATVNFANQFKLSNYQLSSLVTSLFSSISPYSNLEKYSEDHLFLKNDNANYYYEKENNNFPNNTENEKIHSLQYAIFEFIIASKALKEALNHKVSYSFDRILSNFGYSSALSILISLLKPNDPYFLFITFFIIGVVQEIFRED